MRILAIRGQNLASLAEEFEIDLAGGPLGAAGLFAITGPTGAGKSTLLDALCLALFDRAPRLAGRRDAALIGRDEITSIAATDVRSLVRRGATSAWAAVDFEGGDGRRYRARWSVHRARQKVDGRFRDQQMTLENLDTGEKLGGTRTETLDAIRARLGLSFDQFRRSALLAQGDFAAFLRADAAERADLLERMTGTEIYGAVSIAAFQRAKELAGVARAREDELARVIVMSDDERAAAIAAAEQAAIDAIAAAERARAVEALAAWREARASLVEAVETASAREGAARRALESAGDDGGAAMRTRIARLEAAEAMRAPWVTRAQAREEELRAGGAVEAASRGEQAADARLAEALELDAEARRGRAIADAIAIDKSGAGRAEAATAREREARATDARAGDAPGEAAAAAAAKRASGARASGARANDARGEPAAAVRAAIAAAIARLDDARRWIAGHGAIAPIADDWARWQRALAREASAAEAIATARRDEDRLVAAVAEAETRADTADASRAAAAAALEAAQAMAAAAEAKRTTRPADLRRALDALARRADAAAKLVELTARARDAAHAARTNDARANDARDRGERSQRARDEAKHAEARASAALHEAERAADRLRVAAGLTHERAALVDGQPCPLCGAGEHPWAGRGAVDELVVEQEARVASLRAEVRAAQKRGAQAHADRDAAIAEADHAARAAKDARDTRDRLRDAWRSELAALGELALVDDPAEDAAAQLATDRATVAAGARDKARDALAIAEKIDHDASHAQQIALARRADLDHAQTAATDAANAVARLGAQLATARRDRDAATHAKDAAREELAVALGAWPDWRDRLDRARARFAAELEQGVKAWREHVAAVVAAAGEIDRLAERAAALRLTAERDAAAAHAAHAAARDAQTRATAAREAADHELERARAGATFADDELAQLFAGGPDALARLRAQLAELERDAATAAAVLDERRRALAAHDTTRPALESDREPAAARHDAQAAADRARDAALALRLDDDARTRRAVAQTALDHARRDAEPYEILRDLIGSADGKAFRTFAQGLTLDALLVGANAHLDQLAPRYQLERVPKSDLDLQVVDRDLGDDVRAVQSLSGGESFLVSLALALALSSLSAHDVRVRTLLIDEGFGTLDPAALDVALAVLDALQASGRQVGIISHVPGLAERVGAQIAVRPVGSGKSVVRVSARAA
ncbi:MAG TPA: AAA family ATPase [Kofleriaceae bacterium]|nr:AAA family ATPase [Kofleriaceae bacterium]